MGKKKIRGIFSKSPISSFKLSTIDNNWGKSLKELANSREQLVAENYYVFLPLLRAKLTTISLSLYHIKKREKQEGTRLISLLLSTQSILELWRRYK